MPVVQRGTPGLYVEYVVFGVGLGLRNPVSWACRVFRDIKRKPEIARVPGEKCPARRLCQLVEVDAYPVGATGFEVKGSVSITWDLC